MGTERLVLQTSTEQIFSAAPVGLGMFVLGVHIPGLHPLRGFHPGLSSAAPLGLLFFENCVHHTRRAPTGRKIIARGFIPW